MADVTTPQQNNAEAVSKLLDKVSKARKFRDDVAERNRWKVLIEEYKTNWDEFRGAFDVNILPINLMFAYVKTELPSLYIRDPNIAVNPKNRTSIATAKVLRAVINYIWFCKKIKREIKKCIIDALLIGHAWFKVGYTGTFGTVEDGNGYTVETVESEDYFAYRLPWDCITFDTDAIDPPYDCTWIAHDVWYDPEDVKNNPRYNHTVTSQLSVSFEKKDLGQSNSQSETAAPVHSGKIRLVEFWDIKNKTVATLADGVDDFVEAPKPWPYEMKGFPFSFLRFNFSNDMAFGISDVAAFEPQVLELIKIRSAALDHIKRYNRQLTTTPDNISADEEAKLTKGITGSVVKMQDPTKLLAVPYPALQTDIYAIEERIKEDAINISGQSPAERGASQKTSTRTKEELMQIQKGAENRRAEKIDVVEDFVEDIARNLIDLVKQYATDPYYIRILGANSPDLQQAVKERPSAQGSDGVTNTKGFTFTQEDIQGEYDVEVVAGSSTPLDRSEQQKVVMQALEMAPKAGALPGGPLMRALAELWADLTDMPEIKQALEQEQVAQQQAQQQQAQQMQDQQDLLVAQKGSDAQIDAENAATKQNKVLVELIKVLMNSKKDSTENEL